MTKSKCFVPGCKSGYSDNRKQAAEQNARVPSLFQPPKDKELLEKWKRAIPRADRVLKEEDKICEAHFKDEDVVRYDTTLLKDGSLHKIERIRYALTKNAIPCIFPNLPQYLTNLSKKRKLLRLNSTEIQKMQTETVEVKLELQTETVEPTVPDVFNFSLLSNLSRTVKLPSQSWSVAAPGKCIVFAMWGNDYLPVKRLVIDVDLATMCFVNHHSIEASDFIKSRPECLEDVESALVTMNRIKPCAGINDEFSHRCKKYIGPDRHQRQIYCTSCKIARRIRMVRLRNWHKKFTKLRQNVEELKQKGFAIKQEVDESEPENQQENVVACVYMNQQSAQL